jgi:hypothetical protein
MRRYRLRARRGVRCFRGEYDGQVLNFLLRTHWLAEADLRGGDERGVDEAVGRAITALLRDAARR